MTASIRHPSPRRIQLSRKRGWKKPAGAVVCSRPGRWGNWYKLVKVANLWQVIDTEATDDERVCLEYPTMEEAAKAAVELYESDFGDGFVDEHAADVRRELRGKDLCCWCKLCPEHASGKPWDESCADCAPCHVDVLLRVARP